MNDRYLVQHKQRIDDVFAAVKALPPESEELRAHCAKYLCVLVSGFLEDSVRRIYSEYANRKAHPRVASFVSHYLERGTSPKMGRIIELAGYFCPEWREQLEDRHQIEDKWVDHVNSIVANRNEIAHGRYVGLSFVRITDYYKSAVKVIEFIEKQTNS